MRDTTDIESYSQIANVDNFMGNLFFSFLDSPSSTSALTYKTQQARVDQSALFITQRNDASGNATSHITLIELDYS